MVKFLKILTSITLILTAATAYLVVSAQLAATQIQAVVEPASARAEAFQSLSDSLDRGDMSDIQFRQLFSDNIEDYAFVTYTVELKGYCPLPAEWAVLRMVPLTSDVVLIPGEALDIAPFGEGRISATLLTTISRANDPRSLWVEYYVFGRPMSAMVKPAQDAP